MNKLEPPKHFLYLGPASKALVSCELLDPPVIPSGCTRVVVISDTHNEHEAIDLPWGHVLIHSGDVLTESYDRHVNGSTPQETPLGKKLVENFASWFGSRPHPHRILVPGNHDGVLEGMSRSLVSNVVVLGKENVRRILESHNKGGKMAYLLHEEATAGPLKVFGSPFAYWGGNNRAFLCHQSDIYDSHMSENTHILITHVPPLLPDHGDKVTEDKHIVDALHKCNSLLSVSGHCHWAYGLYFTHKKKVPCVVASNCDSEWLGFDDLEPGPSGSRGDLKGDKSRGGYNIRNPVIVCDLMIPGGPPSPDDDWMFSAAY